MIIVAGARPNFMKIAPLIHELEICGDFPDWKLVHTGQHYDYEMSRVFFEELGIPEPHYYLNAGSGSHAEQTARIMVEFEKVCLMEKPDVTIVVGDVNSTLACSVTAKKLYARVAHVEAGLRSGDMSMPEEINRIVTDAIADYLFVTEKSGVSNLLKEGRSEDDIHLVGNVMIDTLYYQLEKLRPGQDPDPVSIEGPYAVVTLHRPSNVDSADVLEGIVEALISISRDMPVIFPAHPRTKKNIEEFGLAPLVENSDIRLMPPLPYMSFLSLWMRAALVLTDSGGLQEETTALGVPCFTIRKNTERPVTIEEGTNTLVGTSREGILSEYERYRKDGGKIGRVPGLWDGRAAHRILEVIRQSIK